MKKLFLALSLLLTFPLLSAEQYTDEEKARITKKIQEIIIRKKKDWPDNYTMQANSIKFEVEAMLQMEELSKKMNVSD